jgi:hypothetical protein
MLQNAPGVGTRFIASTHGTNLGNSQNSLSIEQDYPCLTEIIKNTAFNFIFFSSWSFVALRG